MSPPSDPVSTEPAASVVVETVVVVVMLGDPRLTPEIVTVNRVGFCATEVRVNPNDANVGDEKTASGDCPTIVRALPVGNKLDEIKTWLLARSCVCVVNEMITVLL